MSSDDAWDPAQYERAREHLLPGLAFVEADVGALPESLTDGRFDVVLSNAALHWLPDHPALLARLSELVALGFEDVRVRLEVYGHVVADSDAVVEWVRGSLLTAYRKRMSDDVFERFVDAFRVRLAERLPARPLLYPFKRILFRGVRPR